MIFGSFYNDEKGGDMVTDFAQNIYRQLKEALGIEVKPDKLIIVRCFKASWEYDMDIYLHGQNVAFYQDAPLLYVRELLADKDHGVKIVLLCDCALEDMSCNQVQGFMENKRKAAILHGMKCFLMLVRDKLILSRLIEDNECFFLATINKGEIEFHSKEKKLIINFVQNILQ